MPIARVRRTTVLAAPKVSWSRTSALNVAASNERNQIAVAMTHSEQRVHPSQIAPPRTPPTRVSHNGEWKEYLDETSGTPFYLNIRTGVTQWMLLQDSDLIPHHLRIQCIVEALTLKLRVPIRLLRKKL